MTISLTTSPPLPRYFGFGPDCPPADKRRWEASFLFFMKKLTLRHGHKPLLVKSPVHTARVPLLLNLFPGATFIYCHRNPYEVFQSSAHMACTYYPFCYLNRPTEEDVMGFIVDQCVLSTRHHRSLTPRGPGERERETERERERERGRERETRKNAREVAK